MSATPRYAGLLTLLATLSIGIAAAPLVLLAQLTTEVRSQPETVQMEMGSVFEILADTDSKSAAHSWVLTREKEFIQAGRDPVFQVRFTEEGTYLLQAAATLTGTGSMRTRKDITIEVTPRSVESTPAAASGTLAQFTPPERGGTVLLGKDILELTPDTALESPLGLDLNTAKDADGDLDPANDNDAAATLFSEEHNPLHIWFVLPFEDRDIRLTEMTGDLSPPEQQLTILRTGAVTVPPSTGSGTATLGEITTRDDEGTVSFVFPVSGSDDVVYHWDFGDGTQSLHTSPVHTYRKTGNYTITVSVHSLIDGSVVGEAEKTITITTITATSGSSSSAPETPVTQPVSGGGTSAFAFLLRILLVAAIAIGLGVLVMFGISRLLRRRGGLQQKLEEAEAKLMGKDSTKNAIDVAPPPLELKRSGEPAEAKPAAPVVKPEANDSFTASKEQPIDVTTAPGWLKEGLSATEAASTVAPAAPPPPLEPTPEPPAPTPPPPAPVPESAPIPVPEPLAPPPLPEIPAPVAPPMPAPAPVPTEPMPPATESDLLPPWLRDQPQTDTSVPPAPEPLPAVPVPEPQPPAPMPEPMQTPVTTPMPATPPAVSAPVTAAPVNPEEQERAERERERKRRKRQRYRENLKKRKEETPAAPLPELPAVLQTPAAPAPITEPEPQQKKDDDVAFMIRADNVPPTEEPKS